jgi:hypothetical protein
LETKTNRHRHLVAFPVLVAVLAFSIADTQVDIPDVLGSVSHIFGSTEDERFTFESGIHGLVYAGGQLEEEGDHLVFTKGSALISSKGVTHIESDGIRITTMNGAVHLTRGTRSLVIAALTSPAVIESGDQRMVVPVGMQWEIKEGMATLNDGFTLWMKSRLPMPLPVSFVERKMGDLSLVKAPESVLPELRQMLPLDILPEEQLLLEVSESHKENLRHEHVLGVVRSAVESVDADRFEELLNVPIVTAALATERGKEVSATLLSSIDQQHTVLRMLVLQQIIDNETVWLASSFHPQYRDIAWSIFEPDVSVESHLSRTFLLPFSTFSADDFSDFVFERFAVSLRGMLGKVGDSDAFGEHIVQAHMPLIDRLEERGYPRRAKHLSQTLLELIADIENPTEAVEQAREALLLRDRINIAPLPPKREPTSIEEDVEEKEEVPEPEPEPVPEVTLSTQQVESKAYLLLEDAGALFTVNSAIAAYEGNKARVMDVLFSTESEDRAVSFTLDVVTQTVSDIEINGDTDFPYTPSFEGFVNWVRK